MTFLINLTQWKENNIRSKKPRVNWNLMKLLIFLVESSCRRTICLSLCVRQRKITVTVNGLQCHRSYPLFLFILRQSADKRLGLKHWCWKKQKLERITSKKKKPGCGAGGVGRVVSCLAAISLHPAVPDANKQQCSIRVLTISLTNDEEASPVTVLHKPKASQVFARGSTRYEN